MDEIEKVNMCCYYLIKMVSETEAEEGKMSYDKVHVEGKQLGDWEIIVRKVIK